jgi:hypothetical protein
MPASRGGVAMIPSARGWLEGLRQFAAEYRLRRPVAASPASAAELAAQRTILATHLAVWIESDALALPEHCGIALTTSGVGLAVAEDVLLRDEPLAASLRPRIAAVREIEYRMWTKDHPDPDHALHVNHWSWIKAPVPQRRWWEFQRHPLRAGEQYWLHRTGTSGPGGRETRSSHLWKWDGTRATLLEAFFPERVDAL